MSHRFPSRCRVIPAWEAVLCGIGGAFATEVWALYSFRRYTFATLPIFLRDKWFYVVGSLGLGAAAFVTFLYAESSAEGLSPLLAAYVGATWPLILRLSGERIETGSTPINE